MNTATLQVQGLDENKAFLSGLAQEQVPKIGLEALSAGAEIVESAQESEAPDRSGRTRGAIKIRKGKSSNGSISLTVGVGKANFKGDAFYAGFVLWGRHVGKRPRRSGLSAIRRLFVSRAKLDPRRMLPGNDWMQRAADKSDQSAAEAVAQKWNQGIQQAAAKAGA